jgi:hypothetical protein
MAEEQKPQPPRDAPASSAKRQYRRPALVEYGPISKLTRSGGSTRSESLTPVMMAGSCL